MNGIWNQVWSTKGFSQISGTGDRVISEIDSTVSQAGDFSYSQDNYISNICPTGCTDSLALNYNSNAIYDDGTCCYDCGVIEGFVYSDLDSNSVYDLNEFPLGNQILQLQRSNGQLSYLTTDFNGYFSFIVDTGTQILSFYPPNNWQTTSNQLNYNINVVSMDTLTNLDFGIMPDQTKGDMTIDITSSQTVCSMNSTIASILKILVQNH